MHSIACPVADHRCEEHCLSRNNRRPAKPHTEASTKAQSWIHESIRIVDVVTRAVRFPVSPSPAVISLTYTGKEIVISLTVWRIAQTQEQTTKKESRRLPGPPLRSMRPEDMKSPAPICPPSETT
jgi:hypothetical protein